MDPDQNQTMTVEEELASLRAENQRIVGERDAERRRADEEARRADGFHINSARREAESQIAGLSAQEHNAEATINATTAELSNLKREHSALLAEGKFEEASEIQEKIGDATARRAQAQQAKTYYGGQREQVAKQPTDPVDRFLTNNAGKFSDAEAAWIKRNPRYATDNGFHDRVNRAHGEAVAKGLQPQTAEYFQHLEQVGYGRQAQPEPAPTGRQNARVEPGADLDPDDQTPFSSAADPDAVTVEEPPVQSRPQARSVAAAPSRRAPATPQRNDGGGKITLTPDQAAAALAMSEYAPEGVQNEGEAGIYKWWATLDRSPMARRLRENWQQGG